MDASLAKTIAIATFFAGFTVTVGGHDQRPTDCRIGDLVVVPGGLRPAGTTGSYALTPTLTLAGASITRLDVEVVDSNVLVAPVGCGGSPGPVFGYIASVGSAGGFANAFLTAPPYSFGCRFVGTGTTLNQTPVALALAFPAPTGSPCTDYLHFALRFKATAADCRSTEWVSHYYFKRQPPAANGIEPAPLAIDPSHFPGGGDH